MSVRWGMLSTAGIGRVVARALQESSEATLKAVAGREAHRAHQYATQLGVPVSYGSYEQLLADPHIDAVYIPLPISLHKEWTLKALHAGKHVLCEKPLAMSPEDAREFFELAEERQLHCFEGLMWREHPQTLMAELLIAQGSIGKLSLIRAALSVDVPPGDIRRTGELGGGASLDLGCYCLSAIRLFGGEPARIAAVSIQDDAPGAAGEDLRLAASLRLASGVVAQFDVALDFPRRDELELIGTKGKITIPDPWLCREGRLILECGGEQREIPVDSDGKYRLSDPGPQNLDVYRIEFEAASRVIAGAAQRRFGQADAINQATAVQAVRAAAASGDWVDLSLATTPML